MTVEVDLVRPDVQLDYQVKHNGARTSGEYAGYDRFGRVINHPWVDGNLTTHATDNTVPNIPPIVELDYAYDKASNRTKMLDSRPGASQNNRDMVYTYDGLHRLDEALRGVDGGTFAHAPGSERWSLDMLGNWSTLETDSNGDGDYLDSGESESRTHNDVNELTKIGANDDLTYDHSGNLREQETGVSTKRRFTHDLWNRLVEVEHYNGTSWSTLGEYEYYGTHWRSVKMSDTDGSGGVDEKREMYYSAGWQLIEERIDDNWTSGFTKDRAMQYLWGARYIDDIVMHREDHDGDGSFTDTGSLRWWRLTDVQFSTIANIDDAANVAERVRYDSYGKALHHRWRDVDGDRDYDSADRTIVSSIAFGANNLIGQSGYRAEADLDRDGDIDSADLAIADTNYESSLAPGVLSDSTVKNTIGWDGYVFNPETTQNGGGLYTVRFRTYSTELGRWIEQDPWEYVDGSNLYQFVGSSPIDGNDVFGLSGPDGHHWVPQAVTKNCEGLSDAARQRLLRAKTGYLGFNHNGTSMGGVSHHEYNKMVQDELSEFMRKKGVSPAEMTEELADEFVQRIKKGHVYKKANKGIATFNRALLKKAERAMSKMEAAAGRIRRRKGISRGTVVGAFAGLAAVAYVGKMLSAFGSLLEDDKHPCTIYFKKVSEGVCDKMPNNDNGVARFGTKCQQEVDAEIQDTYFSLALTEFRQAYANACADRNDEGECCDKEEGAALVGSPG